MADKPCSVPDCETVGQTRRGMCKKHYRRYMKHGDPLHIEDARGMTPEQRLIFHGWDVAQRVEGLTPCWEYGGDRRDDGYGRIRVFGRNRVASRVSYEVWVGPIPDGSLIRHTCDNPPCINPEHLIPGTVRQNAQDMLDRGRHVPPQGSRNGRAKISENDAREIFARASAGETNGILADAFGVTIAAISFIRNKKRWTHIHD